jgi:hypothetical protein
MITDENKKLAQWAMELFIRFQFRVILDRQL